MDHVSGLFSTALRPRHTAALWSVLLAVLIPGPVRSVRWTSRLWRPVLKGADYNIAHIIDDELPKGRAEELVDMLLSTLTQRQTMLSLDSIMHLTDPPLESEEDENDVPADDLVEAETP